MALTTVVFTDNGIESIEKDLAFAEAVYNERHKGKTYKMQKEKQIIMNFIGLAQTILNHKRR